MDSPDIPHQQSGSQILTESPLSSRIGSGTDDLSVSELSLSDSVAPKRALRPFSLLAPQRDPTPPPDDVDSEDEEEHGGEDVPEDPEKRKRRETIRSREEKLQTDLFVLRKLNASFSLYNETLRDCKSSTDRVATQLHRTNALLDRYVKILSRSESMTRLIFDEKWNGAEEDEEILDRERREEEEKKKKEAEERALEAKRERDRREKEEQERTEREEKERAERERQAKAPGRGHSSSGVRGVRGTRASMRGSVAARGATRPSGVPAPTTGRYRASTANPAQTGSGGNAPKRPVSSASVRSTASAASSRGGPQYS